MTSPVLLILGAGPKVGVSVAKAFISKGYRVALASRTAPTVDVGQQLHVSVDLTTPEAVPGVFAQVKEKLGAAPSVVVYNAAAAKMLNKTDPIPDIELDQYLSHTNINHTSALVALQEAIKGFRSLGTSGTPKSFIYTGNALNQVTSPLLMTLGLGKLATSYVIQTVVEAEIYQKEGISFYFADERTVEGQPVYQGTDGPAHAEAYVKIAERKDQGPWLYTFAKGVGYIDFTELKLKM